MIASLLILMALECQATVTGSVEIYAVAYYLHEDPANPGHRYTFTTGVEVHTNETVYAEAEGIPVAIEWYSRPYGGISKAEAEFELGITCGEVPDPVFPFIFSDGFESGDLGAWE